jgi:hypothetical protein
MSQYNLRDEVLERPEHDVHLAISIPKHLQSYLAPFAPRRITMLTLGSLASVSTNPFAISGRPNTSFHGPAAPPLLVTTPMLSGPNDKKNATAHARNVA